MLRGVKRGGAGGRGMHALDEDDPNFGDEDDTLPESFFATFEPKVSHEVSASFDAALETLAQFNQAVRKAALEFLVSYEATDFATKLQVLNAPQFHHEVAKVLISASLDRTDEDRRHVSGLLRELCTRNILTRSQIEFSFRRLFNRLPDLLLDVPNATRWLKEFLRKATVVGLVDPTTTDILLNSADIIENPELIREKKASISNIVREYFGNEDLDDMARSIRELILPEFHHMVVKMAIDMSMDRTNRERELTSRLIGAFTGNVLVEMEVQKAFDLLLDKVESYKADVPDILRLLGCFIARAIVDDCIEPAYCSRVGLMDSDVGMQVVAYCRSLLGMSHAAARLSRVWGLASFCSIKSLKKSVAHMITEYFESKDIDEALKCIHELNAPYFHHEVVHQAFTRALDRTDAEVTLVCELLTRASDSTITKGQLVKGFDRIRERLSETAVDAPNAETNFARIVAVGIENGFLPKEYPAN